MNGVQTIAPAEQIMTFAGNILTWCLSRLTLESCFMLFDPPQPGRQQRPNSVVFHVQWRRYPHLTMWRQDSEVEILDRLAHHERFDTADLEHARISIHFDF